MHQISPNADIQLAHTQGSQKSRKSSPLSIISSAPSSPLPATLSPSSAASSKGKRRAIEPTSDKGEAKDPEEEAEDPEEEAEDPEEEAEDPEEAEDQEDAAEEVHPNARVPVNATTKDLDTQVLKHQASRREKMQKKHDASYKVVIFKEEDLASLAILKEN